MIIVDKSLNIVSDYHNYIFFDIETTGFSAQKNTIYTIGCAFYSENEWIYRQWFLDNPDEEKELISLFLEFAGDYKYIVHYNGTTFDIPFIQKKCLIYNIDFTLESHNNIDVYKTVNHIRKFVDLCDIKQKTIEKACGINRSDIYSGKELITFYNAYVSLKKIPSDDAKKEAALLYDKLSLHNYEDILGLVHISSLLNLKNISDNMSCELCESSDNTLIIKASIETSDNVIKSFLSHIHVNDRTYDLAFNESKIILKLNALHDKVKFFLSDYKNYYYLPLEDTVVHKSVGEYVDRNHRKNATKENCFLTKEDWFVCLPVCYSSNNPLGAFKENVNSKWEYVELNQIKNDINMQNEVMQYVLNNIFG